MIASGYVQVVPRRNQRGAVTHLAMEKLTKNFPLSPEPGALVVRVNLSIDEEVFRVPDVNVTLDAAEEQVVPLVVAEGWDDKDEDE